MKRPSRRKYNNILMISVVVFIGVLQAPQLIKTYLLEPEPVVSEITSGVQPLFDSSDSIQTMHFSNFDLKAEE